MPWIDITQPLHNASPSYPGDPPLVLEEIATLAEDSYCSYQLTTVLHNGTHIDAPMHLLPSNTFIGDYPLERFAGDGVLLDVRGETEIFLRPEYEKQIPTGSIVLLYTGFSAHYGTPAYYSSHPILRQELAQFFVDKQVKMIGFDMPSPDNPPFPIHKLLLSHEIFIIENLTNLEALLSVPAFQVMAFPLPLHGEASLARVVCKTSLYL